MKDSIEKTYSYMKDVSELIDVFGNWYLLITIIAGIIGIICFILLSTKLVNHISHKKINELKKNKKYIPELYVELDDALEILRYFINSNFRIVFIRGFLWKFRLANDFYSIIGFGFLKKWMYSIFQTKRRLWYNIDLNVRKFKYISRNGQEQEYNPYFPDDKYLKELDSYWIYKKLTVLQKKAEMLSSKSVLVVGSAGNGKTNLLCRITEILFKLNKKVVYINARDIADDIYDYLIKQLGFFWPLNKCGRWMVLLYVRFYQPFFIIDAINENDNREFSKKFFTFVDEITVKKAKVIISSREEYFKERFSKDIGEMNLKPNLLKIHSKYHAIGANEVLSRRQNTIIARYATAFNVRKPNDFIANQLFQSLLFLRLYFEVYRNNQTPITSLYRHKVYKKYIDSCIQKYDERSQLKLKQMLEKIPQLMIEQGKYDNLKMSDVTDDFDSIQLFRKFSDDNFLTSRKIIENKGSISEDEIEVISFTFDELRDYCLARSLVKNCDNEEVMGVLQGFDNSYGSPLEGVVRYVYIDAKENNKLDLCQYIIATIFKPFSYPFNTENQFDWGLEVMFDSNSPLNDLERDYLDFCLIEKQQLLNASYYFFFQERNNLTCKLSDLIDIIYAIADMNELKKIMTPYCVDKYINGDFYTGHNEQKKHEFFKRLKICLDNKICPGYVELLYISVLLFNGNDDIGYILKHYHDKKRFLNTIETKTACNELKLLANDLYSSNLFDFSEDELKEELEDCLNEEE